VGSLGIGAVVDFEEGGWMLRSAWSGGPKFHVARKVGVRLALRMEHGRITRHHDKARHEKGQNCWVRNFEEGEWCLFALTGSTTDLTATGFLGLQRHSARNPFFPLRRGMDDSGVACGGRRKTRRRQRHPKLQ
jgi:hypothetical protein